MERSPRSIDKIVEEQVRRWELQRQTFRKPPPPRPVVAISRQYGSGGSALGSLIAERLELAHWDQEIVHAIASRTGAPEQLFASLDEHRRNVVHEEIAVFGHERPIGTSDYRDELMRVLHTISEHGGAVIVGRGAWYVLDPRRTLRIRVVCPLDQRIRNVAERRQLTAAEARAEIEETDSDRRDFIRDAYGRNVDDPIDFDLVINTGDLTLDDATDLIATAWKLRFDDERARR